jgi:hypothetical protein
MRKIGIFPDSALTWRQETQHHEHTWLRRFLKMRANINRSAEKDPYSTFITPLMVTA